MDSIIYLGDGSHPETGECLEEGPVGEWVWQSGEGRVQSGEVFLVWDALHVLRYAISCGGKSKTESYL